jgi:hypothetical protein
MIIISVQNISGYKTEIYQVIDWLSEYVVKLGVLFGNQIQATMALDEKWKISLKEIGHNTSESNRLSIPTGFHVIVLILLQVLIVVGNT